jgi:hypothetical protein
MFYWICVIIFLLIVVLIREYLHRKEYGHWVNLTEALKKQIDMTGKNLDEAKKYQRQDEELQRKLNTANGIVAKQIERYDVLNKKHELLKNKKAQYLIIKDERSNINDGLMELIRLRQASTQMQMMGRRY